MIKRNSNSPKFLLLLLAISTTSVVSAIDEFSIRQERLRVNYPSAFFIKCAINGEEYRFFGLDGVNQVMAPLLCEINAVIDKCARMLVVEETAVKAEDVARIKRIEARAAVSMTSPKDVALVKLAQEAIKHASAQRARARLAKELQDRAIAGFPAAGAAIICKIMDEIDPR